MIDNALTLYKNRLNEHLGGGDSPEDRAVLVTVNGPTLYRSGSAPLPPL